MDDRRAAYVSNHDGDTITLFLDQGFGDNKTVNIRLANVWAPEPKDAGYYETSTFVHDWFIKYVAQAAFDDVRYPFVAYFVPTRNGTYRRSYNRYIATVMTYDGKHSLNADAMAFLLEKGYEGGTGWKNIIRPAGAE